MPAKIYLPDKKCLNCNKIFNRYKFASGRLEDIKDYEIRKFCCRKCFSSFNVGENNSNFNPNGNPRKDGYVRIAINGKRIYLHRYLMEQKLGRSLGLDEHVHHKDKNPENNNINNLELITNSDHSKLHYLDRSIDKQGRFLDKINE
jgi:HNH endonuclease